jgi:hypothetical protein
MTPTDPDTRESRVQPLSDYDEHLTLSASPCSTRWQTSR